MVGFKAIDVRSLYVHWITDGARVQHFLHEAVNLILGNVVSLTRCCVQYSLTIHNKIMTELHEIKTIIGFQVWAISSLKFNGLIE